MASTERRSRTSRCQSGMGDSREAAQGGEQFRPFAAKRCKFFPSSEGEAVAATAASAGAGFPGAANPFLPFETVKHRVEGRQGEAQRTFGLLFNAAADFVAVECTVFENAEDSEFGGAALDDWGDHELLPYV